jgi:hemin uptake protein HemP
MEGLEPPRLAATEPKSVASTNFATFACGRRAAEYISAGRAAGTGERCSVTVGGPLQYEMRIITIFVMVNDPPKSGTGVPAAPTQRAAPMRLSSRDLFCGRRELVIEHQGQEYRLKLTRNDKLILNK